MKTIVTVGPSSDVLDLDDNAPKDVSIRMLSDYWIQVDGYLTRFDVLVNKKQFNITLAGNPESATPEFSRLLPNGQIRSMDDLVLPKHIADRRWATVSRVNGRDLVAKLRALADAVESVLPT